MKTMSVLAFILLSGCATDEPEAGADDQAASATAEAAAPAQPTATASFLDATGRELGTLNLVEDAQGITIGGTLTGVPAGTHGIHLHLTGSCEAPSFESAGAHWNPENRQHGFENAQGPHQGDLPNLVVEADSATAVQFSTRGGKLAGLLDADGAALVIHARADDLRTDPAGDSGDRIACAVISR